MAFSHLCLSGVAAPWQACSFQCSKTVLLPLVHAQSVWFWKTSLFVPGWSLSLKSSVAISRDGVWRLFSWERPWVPQGYLELLCTALGAQGCDYSSPGCSWVWSVNDCAGVACAPSIVGSENASPVHVVAQSTPCSQQLVGGTPGACMGLCPGAPHLELA